MAERTGGLKGHRRELFYGLGSVLFIAVSTILTVVIYRLIVQGWLEGIMPEAVAASMAWVLALAVVILAVFGVLGEMRGACRPAPGR